MAFVSIRWWMLEFPGGFLQSLACIRFIWRAWKNGKPRCRQPCRTMVSYCFGASENWVTPKHLGKPIKIATNKIATNNSNVFWGSSIFGTSISQQNQVFLWNDDSRFHDCRQHACVDVTDIVSDGVVLATQTGAIIERILTLQDTTVVAKFCIQSVILEASWLYPYGWREIPQSLGSTDERSATCFAARASEGKEETPADVAFATLVAVYPEAHGPMGSF